MGGGPVFIWVYVVQLKVEWLRKTKQITWFSLVSLWITMVLQQHSGYHEVDIKYNYLTVEKSEKCYTFHHDRRLN